MLITKLAGESVALGLQWRLLGDDDEKAEANKIARSERRTYGVIARSGVAATLGLAAKSTSALSAAQWLGIASKSTDIILVEPLEGGQFWICSIKDGMPLPTFDLVGDIDDVAEKVDELRQATDGKIPVYAPEGVVNDAKHKGFADLVREVAKPGKISKVTTSYQGVAFGLLLLIVAGVGGYVWTEKQRAIKRQQTLADQARRASNDILGEKQKIIDKQKNDYKLALDQMNRDIASPPPAAMVASWLSSMESIPVAEAGWLAVSADCSGNSCSVSFTRDQFGTMLTFAGWIKTQPWSGGAKIDADLAMVAITTDTITARQQSIESLMNWEAVKPPLYSRLQEVLPAGPRFNFEKAGDPPVFYARKPGEKEELAPPLKLPAALGKWTLKGRYLHEPGEMAQLIEDPNVIVDNLSLRFAKNSIEWTLEGRYVSK